VRLRFECQLGEMPDLMSIESVCLVFGFIMPGHDHHAGEPTVVSKGRSRNRGFVGEHQVNMNIFNGVDRTPLPPKQLKPLNNLAFDYFCAQLNAQTRRSPFWRKKPSI
jgi:hypothetical protein